MGRTVISSCFCQNLSFSIGFATQFLSFHLTPPPPFSFSLSNSFMLQEVCFLCVQYIQYMQYVEYLQYILATLDYCKRLPTSCKGLRSLVFVAGESQSTLSAFLVHGLIRLQLKRGLFWYRHYPKCTKWSQIGVHGLMFLPIFAKFQCAFFNSKTCGNMTIWKKHKHVVFRKQNL